MNKYFEEISHLIKKNEINKRVRKIQNNSEDLETKWNIGRLLVEAQGGEKRATYGNELLRNGLKILLRSMEKDIILLI